MSNMVVQTNVLALNTHRNMKNIGAVQQKASSRLSSGYRINSAADDAAGLAISEKMRAQIRGLDMASKNAQDAQALINTAEGGMQEIDNMIQRIRELVVQAANDTNDVSTGDRQKIQLEINQLLSEIDSMASRVQYNAKTLIAGAFTDSASCLFFQVGPNANQKITLTIGSVTVGRLGLGGTKLSLSKAKSGKTITKMLTLIDRALSIVTYERAKLGAVSNRLDYTMKSLDISSENLSDAESRIRNADIAKEMMNLTKANVLQQAAVSMLAQANQNPQSLLQLLR